MNERTRARWKNRKEKGLIKKRTKMNKEVNKGRKIFFCHLSTF